ncbi:hypothetical protein HYV31_03415 [candidate division WWE3 bacterium]|nr:hypothetical protein [candidate division WWE3 bacterium]
MAQGGSGNLTYAEMMAQGEGMSAEEKAKEAAAMDAGAFGDFHKSENQAAVDNAQEDPSRKGEVFIKQDPPKQS